MIFVTVGTHEQPFDRLVDYMDEWAGNHTEKVIIQRGVSTREPKNCVSKRMISYHEMQEYMENARIVISHGGPSSFLMALQKGKIPIVVPRQKKLHEHVNDHQADFCEAVKNRLGCIIVVEEINELENIIDTYEDQISETMMFGKSNNASFCMEIEMMADEITGARN